MSLLADSKLASRLIPADALELLNILGVRCNDVPDVPQTNYYWRDSVSRASKLAAVVGYCGSDAVKNQIHDVLATWSLPPIANEDALEAARKLRQ